MTEVLGRGTEGSVEPDPESVPDRVKAEVELVFQGRHRQAPRDGHLAGAGPDQAADDLLEKVDAVRQENAEEGPEEERLAHPPVHLLRELPHGLDRLEPPPHEPVRDDHREGDPEPVLQSDDVRLVDLDVAGRPEADELSSPTPEGFEVRCDDAQHVSAHHETEQRGDDERDEPGGRDLLVLHGGSSE